MSTPFVGELRMFGFNFAPKGWAFANGQILSIQQNAPLFSLYGTTYGGNGQTTFGIPNLQGAVPIHRGNNYTQGQRGGETAVTLTVPQMAQHTHPLNVSASPAAKTDPAGLAPARAGANIYGAPGATNYLDPTAVSSVGGGQAHDNMPPYLVINWCVALTGVFPSRN